MTAPPTVPSELVRYLTWAACFEAWAPTDEARQRAAIGTALLLVAAVDAGWPVDEVCGYADLAPDEAAARIASARRCAGGPIVVFSPPPARHP